jgi:hypothetical protein
MAGPAEMGLKRLEGRRLLSGVGDAVAWDMSKPIDAELSAVGEVDYYQFDAQAGQRLVFDSSGMKQFTILDSDGTTKLDHLFIFDGMFNPTPGRLAWTAPHDGNFYISVSGYTAFLIDAPTGPYSLATYAVDATKRPEDGAMIAAGQTISGDLSGAGDIDYYSFDAKAGTIYAFVITSGQVGGDVTAHAVMGVVEVQPWFPQPQQPQDAQEAYPGHNIRFMNLDGQKELGLFAEWVAPASGRYHFAIAPLDGEHLGAYTVVMSQRSFPCDPQHPPVEGTTSQNTQPTASSHSARHRKPKPHHRRPAVHKHAKPAAKENLHSARRKLLSLARD